MNRHADGSTSPNNRVAKVLRAGLLFIAAFMVFHHVGSLVAYATTGEAGGVRTRVTADPKSQDSPLDHRKHILVITSQPYLTEWFGTLSESMQKDLLFALPSESKLSYEYIGGEGVSDPEYDTELVDWLRKKYARIHLDLVICVMPTSSQFFLDHGDSIFPGIRQVYALPSKDQMVRISAMPRSAMVKSSTDPIPETINRIQALLPETDHLLVVSGSGKDDLNYQQGARKALQDKGWPKTAEYITGMLSGELAERLERLPDRTAVLMLTYLQDRNGKPTTTVQVMKAVAGKSRAPIFSFYDTVMGLGIVGGRLSSAAIFGKAIAETALNLFKADGSLPFPITVVEAQDIYDWRQLKKWNIPLDRLPANSDIRFREVSFWQEHLTAVLIVVGILALQAALIIGLVSNLHKRRHAEAELRESEEKYRYLVENIRDVIYSGRVDPDRTAGSATFVSSQAENIFGIKSEELLDDPAVWINHVHPDDAPGVVEQTAKLLADGTLGVRNYRFFNPLKNAYIWLEDTFMAQRDEDGRVVGFFGVARDITERQKMEEERIAREAADESNRAKSAFLASMSHEIRTPMNSILGFAQLLERDSSLTPQQAKHVHIINRSGRHLLNLINDILDMSKIEAGQVTLEKAPFCLKDMLDDLEMMFRSRVQAKGLELAVELDEKMPRYVTADEGKLRQVFVNLMANAVKFTEKGGVSVRVHAEAVEESPGREEKAMRLTVEVEDTGPGISTRDMPGVFDAFRQAEAGVKAGGTGLGLPISRKFVELMGGELLVESEVGKGSCFRFQVSVETAAEVVEQERPESPRAVVGLEAGQGPFRVLVVDDNEENRILLSALLQPVGFEVKEAKNGQEAIAVFNGWSPHVVLMDMRMPLMDGYEATRQIKSTESGRTTPVISVTASVFEDQKARILATGADDYLRKPFRREEVLAVLEKWLKLSYVYADEPGAPLRSTRKLQESAPILLDRFPADLLAGLQQAAISLDVDRLYELLPQVAQCDPQSAGRLRGLIENYDFKILNDLLKHDKA